MSDREYSAERRRKHIKKALLDAKAPITASYFAKQLKVSRQIIVGDVAILRAEGCNIIATPRGYMLSETDKEVFPYTALIVCKHTPQQLREELYTIVDFGATVIDVTIDHAIYGELTGKLGLSSRYDVDMFIQKVENDKNSAPISSLTDGVHLHRIGCKEKATFSLIKAALVSKGIALD